MPELKKLAALILVRAAYVGSHEDFARMVKASLRDVAREARRKKMDAKRRAEERELWELDKEFSPAPIAQALTELGF
jgi:hypothetical protein